MKRCQPSADLILALQAEKQRIRDEFPEQAWAFDEDVEELLSFYDFVDFLNTAVERARNERP